jgi:ABC-type bacteriocin/lantibiotic exporter with double-glycine peptidase domain
VCTRVSAVALNVVFLSVTVGFSAPAGLPPLLDEGCQTACGPIACFVAARSMGVEVSLTAVIQKCKWTAGQLTTLQRMQDTLADMDGLAISAVRLSPDQLKLHLRRGDCAAVLPVRKKSANINHAICAIGVENDRIVAIDYPELKQLYSDDDIAEIWDGQVLLVTESFLSRFVRNVIWFSLPLTAAGLLLLGGMSRTVKLVHVWNSQKWLLGK